MEREPAVTPVMSEMLLITLVLIMIPVVTISLMNQLPEGRVPTVTVMMEVDIGTDLLHTVTLYHKGGDYIKKQDLSVMVRIRHNGDVDEYGPYRRDSLTFYPADSQVFDLGDYVTIPDINGVITDGDIISVSLIGKKSVIFAGDYLYEG